MPEAYQPISLSLQAASREFGVPRTQLRAKLEDTEPSKDGTYSILQVSTALYGDARTERLKLLQAQRRTAERKDQQQAGDLCETEPLLRVLRNGLRPVMDAVEDSYATDQEVDTFFAAMNRMVNDLGKELARQQGTI